ncbi:DNA mismatch repair protein MutS [Acidocella sp.]|uniref:DNA mismatch repair protein MutS n=1 Tax=Acidocella sp. TaxID=50710 RepID=UPI002630E11F|nr:DNA mismatch repair protein MutS [Acidocella sp.]
MNDASGASPAMAQWFAIKARHEDALLFFRMGDFYELFFADAQAASAALDIALTARGSHQGQPVPMCGVPVAQAEMYLARLIRRGFRVAIVEQMEDPAAARARGAKGPLARDVVRLVTPGTLTEEALLEAGRANFLVAVAAGDAAVGVAWADISTGLFETEACDAAGLGAILGRLDPAEILAPDGVELGPFTARRVTTGRLAMAVPAGPEAARRELAQKFGAASLEAFGDFTGPEAMAAAQVLAYITATQMGAMPRLAHPTSAGVAGRLAMDAATRASLELLAARGGTETGSLLGAVKRTVSPAGGRKLAAWIAAPLCQLEPLLARQAAWLAVRDSGQAEPLRAGLRGTPDMARALGRIALGRASPRDLAAVRAALEVAAALRGLLPGGTALLDETHAALDPAPELRAMLRRALAEPAPLRLEDGGAVAAGFDPELDAERALRDDTRRVIAEFQSELAQRYGVASLKIRHHAQLGYVLEAPAIAVEKLRENPELVLRQGMANGARFTHPELSALDQRISEAAARAAMREKLVFSWLVKQVMASDQALAACAEALALADVLQSAANLALGGRFCCPELSDETDFCVQAGRHPVVEAALPPGTGFIPNECDLSAGQRLMLLTGPNMAGKSTFLRQNALLVILAQAGLPVPADAMRLGLVDRLFSRVGAADDLASGRSTFMVEMIETAAILHQAGPRSFVIVDEIGRGTGTRDGLAIAQAVLEALHNGNRCRAIFATHFHELFLLTEALPRLKAHTMRVKEFRGEVVFMHEVVAGAAQKSWGVHVARLAGVPETIAKRAETLLKAAERNVSAISPLPLFAETAAPAADALRARLETLNPDAMTPRAALEALYKLREDLRREEKC